MNLDKLVRENVRQMKAYSSARNMHLDGILLDANENPFDIEGSGFNRYPDPNHRDLRERLSQYHNAPVENIFVGSGSDEIIDLIYRIFCIPGKDNVVIPEPTYGMYKVAAELNDVSVKSCALDDDFQPDTEVINQLINPDTKLIFLCSPNNPTGNLLNSERIKYIADNFDGIVLLDEAYAEFAINDSIDYLNTCPNVIVMRTFSKARGLAGLRIGYCIADKQIIDFLYRVKPPYSLNCYSQKMAIKALNNAEKVNIKIETLLSERLRVYKFLSQQEGIDRVFQSDANFVLFRTDKSLELFNYLKKNGVIIRNRSTQLNLENCLRITIGTPEENDIAMNLIRKFYE
ncbi:MAG: histidinol-phosphate aminotransferase [Melioribacteraceae bacterium]|nr:MAG: histidinol-phosphate aminotransferase [Melioribacteraceae bacterium]